MDKRNYGIDFLRILSMFMVVMLHVLGQGGILSGTAVLGFTYTAGWLLEIACYCAVNCFALTSGFVMLNSKPKLSRLISLWLQVAFYTIITTAVLFIVLPQTINSGNILRALFPVTSKHYWYISAYFGLYLLTPLLNSALHNVSRRTIGVLMLAGLFIFCILPTFLHFDPYVLNGGYSLIWLCMLYLVGGYIKKYRVLDRFKKSHALYIYLSAVVLTFAVKIVIELVTLKASGNVKSGGILVGYTSPTIVLSALGIFIFSAKLTFSEKTNKIISFFAPASLGVYLIHVSKPVWNHLLKGFSRPFLDYNVVVTLLLVFASAVCIYLICSFIELGRINLFKLLKIDALCKMADNFAAKTLKKIIK